jgi:hypothetical protein
MFRTGTLSALLILLLDLSPAWSAEARKAPATEIGLYLQFIDDADQKTQIEVRAEGRRTRAAKASKAIRGRNGEGSRAVAREATGWSAEGSRPAMNAEATDPKTGGPVSSVIDRFVRDCLQEAAQLQNWSFETIARVAKLDDAQRGALERLRGAAADAAQHLSASCPQKPAASGEKPTAFGEQFQAVERVVDAADTAFALIEPALQDFYSALDDEQKGRLLRDMILSETQARAGATAEERRGQASSRRGEGNPAPAATVNSWGDICEHLTAALRSWPIQDIERAVRLSEPQRIAFFELVTASLKAAATLAEACPAETPVTPVRRMATHRSRLAAVRHATRAIQPTLMSFYEALDEGQRVTFAEMR